MKKYNQNEVAKICGVLPVRISKLSPDELKEKGFIKHGKGHGCYYTTDKEFDFDTVIDLKEKKLKLEIEEKQQKLNRVQKQFFNEWSDLYTEAFFTAFAPLKDIMIALKLDSEKAKEWNIEIKNCTIEFKKLSKNIYKKVINDSR